MKFVQEDNPDWYVVGDNVVATDKLADTLLQPGESVEVSITLTWVNAKENLGGKINTAEISKDYNEFGTPDKDSTPNNKVPSEDDIETAPVMLAIRTGKTASYTALIIGTLVILVGGIFLIKKYAMRYILKTK